MPKRKRKEGTNPAVGTVQGTETAKRKPRHDSGPRNDPSKTPSSIQDGGKVVQPAVKPSQPNAVRIIVGSYEKVLCGIDVRFDMQHPEKHTLSLNPVYMFSAHSGAIKCLAANDRYLVSGGSDEVIKIYDLKKRKDLGSLVQHNGAITALQFYSRTHLLSASEDGTICIWRTRDWECMATMKGHKGRVNGMCVHPSGKIAVSVGKDKALRLWNLMTGRKASANRLGEEAFDVKWDDAGDQYAILFDRKIVIYDMSALPKVTIEHHVRIHCIRYFQHPVHGETLMSGTDDKLIRIHSLADGAVLQELKGHRARVKALDTVAMSHDVDVQLVVSASSDGEVKTWTMTEDGNVTDDGSYDSGNRLMCLCLHDAAIEQLNLASIPAKDNSEDDNDSDMSNSDKSNDEEEWNGIEET